MKKGFTLIELIMIIVILGILAVVAIPKYFDLKAEARKASAEGVVAAGNAGAQTWRSMYLIDPTSYPTEFPPTSAQCFEDGTVPTVSGVTFSYDADTGVWTYTLD